MSIGEKKKENHIFKKLSAIRTTNILNKWSYFRI